MLPRLANDPMDRIEPPEPMDPIDSTDPTEPIERTEPVEWMDSTEPRESIDSTDVVRIAATIRATKTIHRFGDGHGRAGRCLIHVVLRRRGVTPALVPPISVVLIFHCVR